MEKANSAMAPIADDIGVEAVESDIDARVFCVGQDEDQDFFWASSSPDELSIPTYPAEGPSDLI